MKQIYETSGSYYQTEFLSYLGKFLDNEDITSNEELSTIERISNILINKLADKIGSLENTQIHKIVAVTLSSHILAEEICDILKANYISCNNLELIKLTNYFEFEMEPAFEQIKVNENTLIVNDVISTGTLNKKLHDSIVSKNANVIGVISISDTRVDDKNNRIEPNHVEHIFEPEIEAKLIWIHKKEIKKYRTKSEIPGYSENRDSFEIVRVNSVLNAPTSELNKSKAVQEKVLFGDRNKEFLKLIKEKANDCLIVGHLAKRKNHHPYFIDTKKLFKTDGGKEILRAMFVQLLNLESTAAVNRPNNNLEKIIRRVKKIVNDQGKGNIYQEVDVEYFKETLEAFEDIKMKVAEDGLQDYKMQVDYIIHAGGSGFDYISKRDFEKFLGLENIKLIRMPRIVSNNDWAIPNIPIQYIDVFKNKKILILESASTTGETLLNLIDSMCYLEVKSIIVFSVISRMREDEEEFISRIHKINNNKNNKEGAEPFADSSIPIDVYFGAHLSLPQYLAESNECPHCKEISEYKTLLNDDKIPKSVRDYLEKSIEYLEFYTRKQIEVDEETLEVSRMNNKSCDLKLFGTTPDYLIKGLDKYKMFLIRDFLGKCEKQKIRNKYFKNNLESAESILDSKENINELLAVLVHEPYLIGILKEFFNKKYELIKELLDFTTVSNKGKSRSPKEIIISRNWKPDHLLFLYSFFFESINSNELKSDLLYEDGFIKKLLIYADNNNNVHCINMIGYIIWKRIKEILLNQKSTAEINKLNTNEVLAYNLNREVEENKINILIESLRLIRDENFAGINLYYTQKIIVDLIYTLCSSKIKFYPITPKRVSDEIDKLILKNEVEGNDHGNLAGTLRKLSDLISFSTFSKSVKHLWRSEKVSGRLNEINTYLNEIRNIINIADIVLYNKIYEENSIDFLFAKMEDYMTLELNPEDNSKFDFANLQLQIEGIRDFYFVKNTMFKENIIFSENCIIKNWDEKKDKLEKGNSYKINLLKGEVPLPENELIIKCQKFVIKNIIFDELEINLNRYAEEIEYCLGKDINKRIFLYVKNKKKNIIGKNIVKSFHGVDNWKSILKEFNIEVVDDEFSIDEDYYSIKFIFN